MLLLGECEKLVELPESFGPLSALKFLDLSGCANLESLPESFGQLKSSKYLNVGHCQNLMMLNGGFEALNSLMELDAQYCESLRDRLSDDEEFLHTIEHTLFHGGGQFVGVESDGGQLVDWSWSCFAGEKDKEVEVDVDVLLTMCDLSLDCNNNALQIVRKEIERRMEEYRSVGQKFQIVYAEAGDVMDKSEEHIRQTLPKLVPTCTCACIPTNNKTSQLFAYALY